MAFPRVDKRYRITGVVSNSRRSTIYRGHDGDNQPVVLKVLNRQHSPADLERLVNEYAIGMKLGLRCVMKPIGLRSYQGLPALLMEESGGEPLDHYVGGPMEVGRFLRLAVRIAAAIAEIHEKGFIHKDLKAENILVHPLTDEVKIIDFGIASELPGQRLSTGNNPLIQGSLPYMSPEQTGRISRTLDQRSDLYSLGVTFYEMLTGKLPFHANDPLEWVHSHVARQAIPPTELISSVPNVLSACVMKLLAKEPDHRYQSARGLQHDLEKCLAEWNASGHIAEFPLGERDFFGRLQLPQKLYGREQELAALLSTFQRVIDSGTPELVLISGYSGIGKSSLVQELEQPVIREQGIFAFGKFDQYKRDIPYAIFVQAFTEVVLEILATGEAQVADWREQLRAALGINGQLIVDVIPAVELIIGRQRPVPVLSPAEAQNRFRIAFRHFIDVFAKRDHPLVLFLDDLQWADTATLDLIEDLLTRPEARHLCVIGAYRDNEVSSAHPLLLTVSKARETGAPISHIALGPLASGDTRALVSDALHCRLEDAEPLANLVQEKTAGNPFFIVQFLTALDAERLVAFDLSAGSWRWDVEKIRQKGFTDNVVELMVERLKRFQTPTQEVLEQLASIGNSADVETLGMVLNRSASQVHEDLSEAIRLGLLLRRGNTYRFSHDRVQEAAYMLIPPPSRAANHLRIGRLLLSHLSEPALNERVFEVVGQINRGVHLIKDETEKARLCWLNFLAGKKAKAAVAYSPARNCLALATSLLGPNAWQENYQQTFDLFLERSECEYLVSNFQCADDLFNLILNHARSNPDRARVYRKRIALYIVSGRYDEGLTVGLQALRLFGVAFPESETDLLAALKNECREVSIHMRGRSVAELAEMPFIADPDVRTIIRLIVDSIPCAYLARPWIFPLLVLKALSFVLRHGNIEESCLVYGAYSIVLVFFEEIQSAIEFSEMSLLLNQKFSDKKLTGMLIFMHSAFINPLRRHVATNPELMERGFRAAIEVGDLVYASFISIIASWQAIERGETLDEVLKILQKYMSFARQNHNETVFQSLRMDQQFVAALKGTTREVGSMDDDTFQETECFAIFEKARFGAGSALGQLAKQILAFTYEQYPKALAAAAQVSSNLSTVRAQPSEATYHFYHALTLTALYPYASAWDQAEYRNILAEKLRSLKLPAESCSANFLNLYALVCAEVARIEGRDLEAMRLYDEAIQSASENGFIHYEALANELAAKFYFARGFGKLADPYLREARAGYARWGATGKVKQMARRYPQLEEERRPLAPTATFALRAEQMDVLSIVKASQAISGEIVIDNLLRKLVEVVMEQAGAQKGYVLLCRKGQLAIEAEALLDEQEEIAIKLLRSLSIAASSILPTSLVNFVARTKQNVLLEDVRVAPKFSTDDYVVRTQPKSVLCLPILRRTELVGLLYLENNLITGAFSVDHLQFLEIVASQAAISLENASFIEQEHAARGAAEEAGKRAALFAEASALFSESLDYKVVLPRFAELVVRSIADWCVVDLIEGDDICRLAQAHADPEKQAVLTELAQHDAIGWDSPMPSVEVMKTGRSLLFPEISEETLRRYTNGDQQRRLFKILGVHTGIVVPLSARAQVLGAIFVAAGSPSRRFSTADLEVVEELARRASIAIDNARLYRQTVEALRLRDEFLTVAAHELRTPITSLALTLDSMNRSAEPESSRNIGRALRQGQRLKRLVGELLDVTRLESGHLHISPEQVELGTLARDVVDRFTPELTSAQCSIVIDAELPVFGWWDRSQIEQVLTNLLSNAIKFGPGKQIEISVGREREIARLVVRDHGIGIDPAAQSRLFQRFGRAVSERHYGGLGLGLYICRRIIEAHDGSIRVLSQPGEGATFTVELPCMRPEETEARRHGETLSVS
jgi:predicted ATPase/signal transduction histidine kinase